MAKQIINIGAFANDGTGSTLRDGGNFINSNFNEIYTALGDGTSISSGNFITEDSINTITNKTIDIGNNTLSGTLAEFNTALQDGSFATLDGTETLTGKTINASSNTLSNIGNSSLTNSSITIGSDEISLGNTQTDLNGLTSLDIDNISIDGNTITSTTGTLSLTNVSSPTNSSDAATKEYVDTIAAAGIHYHDPVRVEAIENLIATYDNGTNGVGATLTNAGTAYSLIVDGVTLSLNDRVLVYQQTNAVQNGIYTVTEAGDDITQVNWVLTRATDADSYAPSDPDSLGEGDAFFVSEGNTGAGELYVMTTAGEITFGTTEIIFSQISSRPTFIAGDAIDITGSTFSVLYDNNTIDVDITSGELQVKDDGIDSTKLKSAVNLQILNSSGGILKTLYGSGS